MPGEKGRALRSGSLAGTVPPQFHVLCACLSSTVASLPSLPLGSCLQATDSGCASFAMWYFCSLIDCFSRGKAISPQTHVNVKKSSMLLVVVFYIVQNKNDRK